MEFWKRQCFVVTGGAGFLGSRIAEKLYEQGAETVIVPRSIDYDLRRQDAILDLLHDTQPDVIIHAAALTGGIGANRARPAEFFYDNLIMGVQLMHEAQRAGVKKFVTVGTVCAYPKIIPLPFRESDLWAGYPEETNAPYGLAKKMLLVQGQAYRQQYGFNAIYLLPTNLYGPGDNFNLGSSHVIPALIRKCLEARARGDEQIVAWGTGSPTRDFLYVDDAAAGIVLAAQHYDSPEPVNLGSGVEVSIKALTETVAELTGFQGEIVWDSTKPDGQPRRVLSNRWASRLFGFESSVSFREGLAQTITWYLESVNVLRGT